MIVWRYQVQVYICISTFSCAQHRAYASSYNTALITLHTKVLTTCATNIRILPVLNLHRDGTRSLSKRTLGQQRCKFKLYGVKDKNPSNNRVFKLERIGYDILHCPVEIYIASVGLKLFNYSCSMKAIILEQEKPQNGCHIYFLEWLAQIFVVLFIMN